MVRLHGASSARVASGHTARARHHVQAGQLYLRELRGLEASRHHLGPAGGRCLWILESQSTVCTGRLWLNSLKATAFSRGLFLCFPVFAFRAMAFGLARLGLLSAMSVA